MSLLKSQGAVTRRPNAVILIRRVLDKDIEPVADSRRLHECHQRSMIPAQSNLVKRCFLPASLIGPDALEIESGREHVQGRPLPPLIGKRIHGSKHRRWFLL
jgi:hypothetical protein